MLFETREIDDPVEKVRVARAAIKRFAEATDAETFHGAALRERAKQIASRIAMPGFIEYLSFDRSMAVKEFTVKRWAGKSLIELNLTNSFGIQVIAVRRSGSKRYEYIPKADELFQEGDNFVAIGKIAQMTKIVP